MKFLSLSLSAYFRQESLVKCTGIHTGALCVPNTVEVVQWHKEKTSEDWARIIGGLDASRDVLLFPSVDAIVAQEFDWTPRSSSSSDHKDVDASTCAEVVNDDCTAAAACVADQQPYPKWRLVRRHIDRQTLRARLL
jgi:hypothetical protein